jgi:hypothetical protein
MTDAHGRRSPRHPDEDELVRAVDASVALRQLLAAASAPPSTAELKGRSRALADFRAAQLPHPFEPEPVPVAGSAPGDHPARPRWTGRWSAAQVTVVVTAILVLLGGTAAARTAGEFPTALRNAVAGLFTDPAPGGTPSEQPLRPRPGRTGPAPSGTGSPAAR